jgi:hypothetical protein
VLPLDQQHLHLSILWTNHCIQKKKNERSFSFVTREYLSIAFAFKKSKATLYPSSSIIKTITNIFINSKHLRYN